MRYFSIPRDGSLSSIALIFLILLTSPIRGQANAQLDTFNDHLLGTWKGINHDYMKVPAVTSAVTLLITKDKKPDPLKMTYTYVQNSMNQTSRYTFLLRIDPNTSTFFRDRRKFGKDLFDIEGLDKVLQTGYGDFKLKGIAEDSNRKPALYRADYHLTAQAFSYEVYLGVVGKPFFKTGDSFIRENSAP